MPYHLATPQSESRSNLAAIFQSINPLNQLPHLVDLIYPKMGESINQGRVIIWVKITKIK